MEAQFEVELLKRIGHYNMQEDDVHAAYEIYYLLSGQRHYFIDGNSYVVHAGDLVLIPPYALHKTADTGLPDHERFLIQFTPPFFQMNKEALQEHALQAFGHKHVLSLNAAEQRFVEPLLRQILQEHNRGAADSRLYVEALMLQLLLWVNRIAAREESVKKMNLSASGLKVEAVLRHMQTAFREDLSLSDAARQFYVSPYHLCRIFKQHTGFSFTDYLHLIRIKEAQRLLSETRLKVVDIAEQVGFGNLSHFQQVFKRITGLTPLQYRKIQVREG